jgi:Ni/Co efflux regulator RcnB
MKLKSLIVAVMMFAFAGASMAATAPAKKHAHKKAHAAKIHKVKHKKAAVAQ